MQGRYDEHIYEKSPGPGAYDFKSRQTLSGGYTYGTEPRDKKIKDMNPGPGVYSPKMENVKGKGPSW